MTSITLLSATLGLAAPWEMTSATLSETENRIDMVVDFTGGTSHPCPNCGTEATICSVNRETWHLPAFFRFGAYLHAGVPVLGCPTCGPVRIVPSWNSTKSGFIPLPSGSPE